MSKIFHKVIQTISISIILIIFVSISSFPSLAYAQESPEVEDADLIAEILGETEDPTKNEPDSKEILPDLAGEVTESCITMLVGHWVAGAITSIVEFGLEFVLEETLSAAVPVTDSKTHTNQKSLLKKETGSGKFFGVEIFPSLDGLQNCLTNAVIESLLQSTINWVNSGFDGNPAFIDDPEQFFLDLADHQVAGFLNEMTEIDLCSPWSVEIQLAILSDYTGSSGPYQSKCTLSEIVGNVEGFVNDDFRSGGWEAWFKLTQEPNNNPYGSYTLLNNRLRANVRERDNTIKAEIGWNTGFLSATDSEGRTTTPGTLMASHVGKWLSVPVDRITFADEFDELITVLVNEVVTTAMGELLDE